MTAKNNPYGYKVETLEEALALLTYITADRNLLTHERDRYRVEVERLTAQRDEARATVERVRAFSTYWRERTQTYQSQDLDHWRGPEYGYGYYAGIEDILDELTAVTDVDGKENDHA